MELVACREPSWVGNLIGRGKSDFCLAGVVRSFVGQRHSLTDSTGSVRSGSVQIL